MLDRLDRHRPQGGSHSEHAPRRHDHIRDFSRPRIDRKIIELAQFFPLRAKHFSALQITRIPSPGIFGQWTDRLAPVRSRIPAFPVGIIGIRPLVILPPGLIFSLLPIAVVIVHRTLRK